MALKQNTYDIGDNVVPNSTNTAATGDAITINAPTGSPTHICLNAAGVNTGGWAGVTNQGCRFTGIAGDVQQHQYTQTASNQMVAGVMFYVDSAAYPTASAWCIARWRSASTNAAKLMLSTSGVIQFQNAAGSGIKNFNGNAAAPNGWYYADVQIQRSVSGSGTTDGIANVQIYKVSDGSTFDTYSASNINMGTADITTMQWGKTESAAAGQIYIKYPRFNTGTLTALGMPSAPASSFTLLKKQTFEGGTNGSDVTTTNPPSTSGNTAFDLVQTNSQRNKLGNAAVVNGSLSLEMEQNVGSTSQVINYWTFGSARNWIGITTMVRLSKVPTTTFTAIRGYATTSYGTTEFNFQFTSAGKIFVNEDVQAGNTSTGVWSANTWYCLQLQYRVSTNQLVATLYARGTSTVVATASVTLTSAVGIGSMALGIISGVDTGNTRVTWDDPQVGENGLPDRTDIGNIPPVVNSLSASKTIAEAGGTVAITADASDADGSVANAIWDIVASNGVAPPTLNNQTVTATQFYCRAALVNHTYTISYTPIDDQGLSGETATVTVNVNKSTEIVCSSPGVNIPLVWYIAQ